MEKKILNEEISRIKQMMGRINESEFESATPNVSLEEEEELDEIGMYWLTKIKVNSAKPMSDEKKLGIVQGFQAYYNGKIAVEFEPGEWFDDEGKIDDIDTFEQDVHNNLYAGYGSHEEKVKTRDAVQKHHGNAPVDSGHFDVHDI